MTAKSYVDGLTYEEFAKLRELKDNSPDFYHFLAEPSKDVVKTASFAMQCQSVGIPNEFTRSADTLHYLVVAINNRASGNV